MDSPDDPTQGGETGSEIDDPADEIGDEHGDEQGNQGGDGGDGDGDGGDGDDGDDGDGDGGDGEGDGDGDQDDGPDYDLPENGYCRAVFDWDPEWAAHGVAVMELINEARTAGGNCGLEAFPPVPPLAWDPALACAARAHAGDMAVHDFFDHQSSDGKDPNWRYEQAGFAGGSWAENLGAGYSSPADMVAGWFTSDSQCAHMRNPKFTWIGVGYAFNEGSTYKSYWTLSLGAP